MRIERTQHDGGIVPSARKSKPVAQGGARRTLARQIEQLEHQARELPPNVVHRTAQAMRFHVLASDLSVAELASLTPRLLELVATARAVISGALRDSTGLAWSERIEGYSLKEPRPAVPEDDSTTSPIPRAQR